MSETLLGLIIGVFSSLVAGVILMWKGDEFVIHLKKRPTRRRVFLYSRAYLRALHSYPYHYLHLFALASLYVVVAVTTLIYVAMTIIAFTAVYSDDSVTFREAVHTFLDQPRLQYGAVFVPWFFAVLTIFLGAWIVPKFYTAFSIEALIPYAHREVQRLRECVAKCGTPAQFIAYTDAEHNAKTLADLKALIAHAKSIIGDHPFHLADEILEGITDEGSGKTLHLPTTPDATPKS